MVLAAGLGGHFAYNINTVGRTSSPREEKKTLSKLSSFTPMVTSSSSSSSASVVELIERERRKKKSNISVKT